VFESFRHAIWQALQDNGVVNREALLLFTPSTLRANVVLSSA
jgi:hypothetical protein